MKPNQIPTNISPILQAIMQNSKYTDAEADAIENAMKERKEKNMTRAMLQLASPQSIASCLSIPSKIKPEDINQKTEVHPNFKNYDHSLEMSRTHKLGLKSKEGFVNEDGEIEDGDGIVMGNMGSQDV